MTEILNYTKSEEIFSAAQELMPGGVSSPVRAFKSVGGQPIVFDRVKGPFAWDIDGNRYIDYIGSWGPAICGHAHPEVTTALQEALEKGCLLYTSPSPRDSLSSRRQRQMCIRDSINSWAAEKISFDLVKFNMSVTI